MGAFDNPAAFAYRVLVAVSLAAGLFLLLYFIGQLIDVLLLVFAAVLVAVAIDGVTRLLGRYIPVGRLLRLLGAFALIALLLALLSAIIWPQAAEQLPRLAQQLPEAVERVAEIFEERVPGGEEAMDEADKQAQEEGGLLSQDMLTRIFGIFSTTLGAISSFLLILLIGVYLVISPSMYADHLLRLIPAGRRERLAQVLALQGHALRLWLLGRLLSMLFVGVTAAVGMMLIGVPMAFTLGLIAGVATFIPYLGPFLGAVPAVLVSLLEGPEMALYVVVLYFAVETAESSVITPLVQRRVVHIPPAYTVILQIAGGVVAGVPGVILATPLAVVAAVAVQMLYIEDVLGEQVDILGE